MKTLIVIGGGASGFFCAVNAAQLNPNLKVILLEKQSKVLQKVKVSGGGRCNVTHQCDSPSELLKAYPRGKNFLKKTFSHFTTQDTILWFESRGVKLKTETDGRMFPTTDSSQTIIDCLLQEATKYQVEVRLNSEVVSINQNKNGFDLTLKNGVNQSADYLYIATGGYPKSEQYNWLLHTGHKIEIPAPSLFTFNIPDKDLHELMGVTVEQARIKITGSKLQEEGPVLITHWGLSGPAVLRLSAWGARELQGVNYHFSIQLNWINIAENELREKWNLIRNQQGSNTLGQKNPFGLQSRLWHFLLQRSQNNTETKWSELTSKEQNKLIHILTAQEFEVKGKTTFKEEFVTCGGLSLEQIDPHTLQSKLVPGLYFGGELIDVDGITGGYNFQNAWTCGYVAAKAIASLSIT